MSKYILAHDMGTSGTRGSFVLPWMEKWKSVHGDYPTYFGENGAVEQIHWNGGSASETAPRRF